jgi:predicted peptidase
MARAFFASSLLAVAIAMPSSTNAADNRDRFEARTFADGDFKLPYRLLKPKGYNPRQKYPLVIFLHGAGERGVDNQKQLVHGMNDFASDEIMAKYPAFVIAPQCPEGKRWVEVEWTADAHVLPEEPSPQLSAVLNLIAALQREFAIDDKRIYITGLSMGGFGVWDALSRWPEQFAGAVPICSGGDPVMAKQMMRVPIWAFHGTDDKTVKVHRSREMIEALKERGGDPKYTEYPGVAHNSWERTYADPAMYAWLFAQRKP